jgi:hypothetical protein
LYNLTPLKVQNYKIVKHYINLAHKCERYITYMLCARVWRKRHLYFIIHVTFPLNVTNMCTHVVPLKRNYATWSSQREQKETDLLTVRHVHTYICTLLLKSQGLVRSYW